jgi:hypothetical protein
MRSATTVTITDKSRVKSSIGDRRPLTKKQGDECGSETFEDMRLLQHICRNLFLWAG